ncbi:hypothetical protein RclHR1_22380001 [Rhizophagus clarus]|uniref:Uncharacterized protein n=1 Tax=Rhizophagus clarus TaxID=94130 RepID=A0A2Z6R7U2_9GLOM|nr:hypothetical protein RclHR1_22380001 [Rhizophagus clarus]GET00719.1 hypothetical protein RCL_jg29052.t1 [Rhizophagus clarus]
MEVFTDNFLQKCGQIMIGLPASFFQKSLDDQTAILINNFGKNTHPYSMDYPSITKHLLDPASVIFLVVNAGLKVGLSALYSTFVLIDTLMEKNLMSITSNIPCDMKDIIVQDTNNNLSRNIPEVPPTLTPDKTKSTPSSKSGQDKTESHQQSNQTKTVKDQPHQVWAPQSRTI